MPDYFKIEINFLIAIDAHSKWIEAFPATSLSTVTIKLCPLFAQFGLPEIIGTDNDSCFVSAEFQHYLTMNGVKHITLAPYVTGSWKTYLLGTLVSLM